jgi:histidyl-tRNA synthetase
MSYGGRSRKAQMKQANASGAAYAVIIGEEELANSTVSIKDLQGEGLDVASKQVLIPQETLVEFLSSQER